VQTIVNLSEQSGREAAVTLGYKDAMLKLANPDVKYQE
jgi:hypothetical protein